MFKYARICFVLLFLSMPLLVSAQGFPKQIVPEGCNVSYASGEAKYVCTCDHLVELANNAMTWGIYMAIMLSVFLFIYAGFRYMNNMANPVEKQDTKNLALNIIIGLILVLGSTVIVTTIVGAIGKPENTAVWKFLCNSSR